MYIYYHHLRCKGICTHSTDIHLKEADNVIHVLLLISYEVPAYNNYSPVEVIIYTTTVFPKTNV